MCPVISFIFIVDFREVEMFSIGWIGDCTKAKLSAKSPTSEGPSFRMFGFELAVG